MKQAILAMLEFNEKHGFPVNLDMPPPANQHNDNDTYFKMIALSLKTAAKNLETRFDASGRKDYRLLRFHLILEELSESLDALLDADEDRFADGLADLAYVVVGTAITYGIPLGHVFFEVHQANMRKRGGDGPRLHNKGDDWTPPDIEGAISDGRRELCW